MNSNSNPTIPVILEYLPILVEGQQWRVERFDLLAAEFLLDEPWDEQMTMFHGLACAHVRRWLIVRRLFGVAPLISRTEEDLSILTREQLCELLSITAKELQAEMDALRAQWQSIRTATLREHPTKQKFATPPADVPAEQATDIFNFGHEILEKHCFPETMFTEFDSKRSPEQNRLERDWFAKRASEWDKMLSEPMAESIAREALLNELYLRRLQMEMTILSPSSKRWQELLAAKNDIEVRRETQLEKLQEMFPESSLAGKVSFRAVISELIQAHREYYANGDRMLIDKMFTHAEIEVLLRQSVQQPQPQYRFGLAVATIQAMNNLYDPNYRSRVKLSVFKKMDAAFRHAVNDVREELREPLVNLEEGVEPGEGDDFPDLQESKELQAEPNEIPKTEEKKP
ncbi:MAG TPA: hypothetical protein VMO20_09075 [Candidatus Acidoferrum sp.]|nr:hypothetical protein [Candidatus Acidoferrum sp.]